MTTAEERRARKLQAEENRAEAVRLRKRGKTYQFIADELGITKQSAHAAVQKAMKEIRTRRMEDTETLLTLELERLDMLLDALWDKAMNGQHMPIDRILKIMERRARLLGIDAPLKVAPTNPEGDEPYTPVHEMSEDERDARIGELLKNDPEMLEKMSQLCREAARDDGAVH
ncbi:MAG: hypothetical protein AAFY29_22815 [Pseudomonadota bacterium]